MPVRRNRYFDPLSTFVWLCSAIWNRRVAGFLESTDAFFRRSDACGRRGNRLSCRAAACRNRHCSQLRLSRSPALSSIPRTPPSPIACIRLQVVYLCVQVLNLHLQLLQTARQQLPGSICWPTGCSGPCPQDGVAWVSNAATTAPRPYYALRPHFASHNCLLFKQHFAPWAMENDRSKKLQVPVFGRAATYVRSGAFQGVRCMASCTIQAR